MPPGEEPLTRNEVAALRSRWLLGKVIVDEHVVSIPLNRILLARVGNSYCAVKFTDFQFDDDFIYIGQGGWTSWYETYLIRNPQSGAIPFDLLDKHQGKVHIGKISYVLLGHWWAFGTEDDIDCQDFDLRWYGASTISLGQSESKRIDKKIALAPTEWTDMSEVNLFDPRLTWYYYDESREKIIIPMDELWPD